jgi:penicillin amidase
MLGTVHTTPLSSRSTYAHVVEFGDEGPLRIESMFPLGQSGTILMDSQGAPVFDEHFFSMAPHYDAFAPRDFPLFE